MTLPKVLLVDDEPLLLEALERTLEEDFEVRLANGGEAGLAALREDPDTAVVVSDMRMPGMDGAEFLSRVPGLVPHSARILLTGQSDLVDASRAVNRGGLFRFLLKPCPAGDLVGALRAGVAHHDLLRAEQDLLERTVNGAIELLVEVLQLTDPAAFSTGATTRRIAKHLASALNLTEPWVVEAAALMSPLGKVSLAPELIEKARIPGKLGTAELNTYKGHPAVGARLLRRVPRLEAVADLVEKQLDLPGTSPDQALMVLQIAVAAADLYHSGVKRADLPSAVNQRLRSADRKLVALLESVHLGGEGVEMVLRLEQLRPGMSLLQDVKAKTGALLAVAGLELNLVVLERLQRFHTRIGVVEPIRVHSG